MMPDPALHRRPARPAGRPRHHPRARGSYRRRRLAVAAAALPGLRHAVRRRGAAAQAGRGAAAQPGEAARGRARRRDRPDAVQRCSSCAWRTRSPRRRRWRSTRRTARCCTPATGSSTPSRCSGRRTDEAAFAALGEEGVLAMVCDSHQRDGRGPLRLGSRGAAQPVRADPRPARAGRGHLLRQQRRARWNRSRWPRAMPAAASPGRAAACATSTPPRASAAT